MNRLHSRAIRSPLALLVMGLHGLLGAALWQLAQPPRDAGPGKSRAVLEVRLAAPERPAMPLPSPGPAPASPLPPTAPLLPPPEVIVRAQAASVTAPVPLATLAPTWELHLPQPPVDRPPDAGGGALQPPAPSSASPPPVAARPAARPSRQNADHRSCARAPYPAVLRERGIQGELRLRVHVAPDGRAAEVQLLTSSGWRLFDEAAMAQVRACRFRPAEADGQAVADWVEFPVQFRLDG